MDLSVLNKALNLKTGQIEEKKEDNSSDEKILLLDVDKIKADPNQPRKIFNAEDIQLLADDIRAHGLIQPIIVRTDGLGQYIVVTGERRLRAFQLLKEPKIKAILRNDYSSDKLGYIQIAENIKRADLKFYELAEFIISKVDAGVKQTTLADEMGISRSFIACYLSWKDAPEFLKEAKDKFSSIRAFYDLVNLAQEEGEAVKEFVANCDGQISKAAVTEFKKSLTEPQLQKSLYNDVGSNEVAPNEIENTDETGNAEKLQEAPVTAEGKEITETEEDQSPSEDENDDDSSDSSEQGEANEASEVTFEAVNKEKESDNAWNDVNTDSSVWVDEEQDLKIKKPLIVGSVEGREGYLQYKKKPSTDGFVWVKWEDGFEEEILAEKFRINRIIEE